MPAARLFLFAVTFLFVCAADAVAAVPQLLSQQGRLLDEQGQPLNGPHDLTIRLYEDAVGGAPVWSSDVEVSVVDGIYTLLLTDVDSAVFDLAGWMGISVDSGAEMTPRLRFTTVPFSFLSENASRLGGVAFEEFIKEGDVATDSAQLGGLPPAAYALAAHSHGPESITGTLNDSHIPTSIARVSFVESGFAAISHTHTADAIVSGTFDDGRIPSSVVRASQITDVVRSGNVIYVRGNQAEFLNGQALLDAVSSASPSFENPIVIRLEAGVFDIGSNVVNLKSRLTIEGAGAKETVIHAAGPAIRALSSVSAAGIRNLTVRSDLGLRAVEMSGFDLFVDGCKIVLGVSGPGQYYGILGSGNPVVVTRSRIEVNPATGSISSSASVWGVSLPQLTSSMRDSDVHISLMGAGTPLFIMGAEGAQISGGSVNISSTATFASAMQISGGGSLRDVKVSAVGPGATGVRTFLPASFNNVEVQATAEAVLSNEVSGELKIRNSVLSGLTSVTMNAGTTARIAHSELSGPLTGTAAYICVGAYNGSFTGLNTSCQ